MRGLVPERGFLFQWVAHNNTKHQTNWDSHPKSDMDVQGPMSDLHSLRPSLRQMKVRANDRSLRLITHTPLQELLSELPAEQDRVACGVNSRNAECAGRGNVR